MLSVNIRFRAASSRLISLAAATGAPFASFALARAQEIAGDFVFIRAGAFFVAPPLTAIANPPDPPAFA
jgi:hypothetical protein